MAATSKNTPINAATATFCPMRDASMPSKATMAKVLIPTSLLDHSRSMPASIPMPMATPIFKAMGVTGKCAYSVCIFWYAPLQLIEC
jgi:hypothetical protein